MGLIIDSSVLIEVERNRFDLDALLEAEAAMTGVFISTITVSELLHGVERAETPARRQKRLTFAQEILEDIPAIPFGVFEARLHAKIWGDLAKKGRPIGAYDLTIAATALAGDHQLATLNRSEFERVEGLKVPDLTPFLLS